MKTAARVFVIAVGALYAWHSRFFVNPDGVAYLDVADRFLAHGWSAAIHTHRSPLYPVLLAIANRVFGATAANESTIAHGITFLMYCLAFAAFEFLLAQLREAASWWRVLAYALFLWCCNFADQTGPDVLTPDLLVAAAVFAGAALLVRIANGTRNWTTYIALGLTLGAGYLAKEAMMPLGILMLIVAALAGGRRALPRLAVTAVLFILIASAYFIPLSRKLGRPSTGETARYNYILWIAHAGQPAHPKTIVHREPLVVAYPSAAGAGTFAVHDDLRFWLDGMRPQFDLHAHLHALLRSIAQYAEILASPIHLALLIVYLTLLFSSADRVQALRRCWYLTLPSLAALAMYGVVLVQPRYVGPSLVVLWIGLFAGLAPDVYHLGTRAAAAATLALLIVLLPAGETRSELQELRQTQVNENLLLAQQLARNGVHPGDRVAVVGEPYLCYWARLAKVRIDAEVPNAQELWHAPEPAQRDAIASLKAIGIRAVIATDAPENAPPCWQPVDGTPYSLCAQ